MKKISFSLGLLFALQVALKAQPVAPAISADTNAPVAAPTIVGRSPNERTWGWITSLTNTDGSVRRATNRAYTELGSGLCKFSSESNAWVDADPTINIGANNASASGTINSVTIAGDAAAAGGATQLIAPDGKKFAVSVYGLAYFDAVSGSNVLLGKLQSAQGLVVGDNEVVFSNIFSGSVTADLEYFNRPSGIEQNLVLRTSLPSPESFVGAGLSNGSTMLELWSEFLAPAQPQITEITTGGNPDDLLLDFGAMKIPVGTAFTTPPGQGGPGPTLGTRVLKRWITQDSRTFLVEQVPYKAISNQVQNLPPQASSTNPGAGGIKNTASLLPLQPRTVASTTASAPIKVAQSRSDRPGFVIDYTLVTGTVTNFVFEAGNTYYLTANDVYLYGTNVFEPGTIVKFSNGGGYGCLYLTGPSGMFLFNGSAYAPSVFTDMNDNTVGNKINGSSGIPSEEAQFLVMAATNPVMTIAHARFSFSETPFTTLTPGSVIFRHCQFANCWFGINLDYFATNQLYLQNVLAVNCTYFVGGDAFAVYGENLTADQCSCFATGSYSGYITNSIFTEVGSGTNFSLTNTLVATSGAGIYQPTGNGHYYLTNNVLTRGAGTTSIDAQTLADLQTMTTYTPVVYSNRTLAVVTNFGQTVLRDGGAGTLDIGYHYPSLDYVFGGTMIGSNVTFTPGVAVGWFNPQAGTGNGYGIYLSNYVTASFQGTEEAPVWWVRANTVQETGYGGAWPSGTSIGGLVGADNQWNYNIGPSPVASLNFTKCSILGAGDGLALNHFRDDYGYLIVSARNSEFYGGCIGAYINSGFFTNCLFYGAQGNQIAGWTSNQWIMRACTMHNGSLTLVPYYTAMPISILDCAFDGTVITLASYGLSNNATYSYNAFGSTNTNCIFPVGNSHSVTNTNGFNWQTSWLGSFYLPPGSSNLNAGDASAANYGLYHFTTQTNQVPQGNATVDIGYHYVATDAYGNGLSTSGDSLPDYIADSNGDGVYDAGDVANWLNPFLIFDQGVSYGGFYPPNVRLGYWRFNNATHLTNEAGVGPILQTAVNTVSDWSGLAISVTNASSALEYPVSGGATNYFNPAVGSIRFWYQPNWSATSGDGPMTLTNGGTLFQTATSAGSWGLGDKLVNEDGVNSESVVDFVAYSSFDYGTEYGFNQAGQNGVVMDFQSNLWYQIVFTYSPSNTALYCDGKLVGTGIYVQGYWSGANYEVLYGVGCGDVYYPALSALTGFYFGGQPNYPAMGQLDELETFNYPLTAQAVAAGYPYFGGNSNVMQDTYYIGVSDMLQNYVYGLPPSPNNAVPVLLGYWRFDSPCLYSEEGAVPTSQSGVTLTPSWSGTSANFSGSASQLTYADVNSNGWANFNCRQGSLRFWFKPTSTSSAAPFVYMGNSSGSQQWALWLTNSGSSITFVTESNSVPTVLPAACSLSTANWTQIVLTYGPTNSYLYTNGVLLASNSGVVYWPSLANRQSGMVIGNTIAYNHGLNGQIEELETFNYQLAASEISSNFQTVAAVDANLDGIPDLLEDSVFPLSRPFLRAPVVITGTIEAEQFDIGGPGVAYHASSSHPTNSYRPTGMYISSCTDLGGGYCLDQTQSNDWAQYTINVLVPQQYMVEVRAQPIGGSTGGVFQCEFTNVTAGGSTVVAGPMQITNTIWTNYSAVVSLNAGINLMRLHCSNNAPLTTNVGRFNYISIYPWWQVQVTNTYTNIWMTNGSTAGTYILVPGTTNNTNWAVALNNATNIQNAINSFGTNGGTVHIPPGTFMIAQANPNEAEGANFNAAVSILTNNVVLVGAGMNNTTLIAYNRATTIFCLGADTNGHLIQCTNFTLRDMTLEGQPHRQVSNTNNTVYSADFFVSGGGEGYAGSLVVVYGPGGGHFSSNILITNCQFLSGNQSIILPYWVSDMMVRECNFVPTGLPDTFGSTNVYAPPFPTGTYEVSIFAAGGTHYNLVVLEDTYNGNCLLTSTNSSYTEGEWLAPDGFVWFQDFTNAFVARNFISNYALEAVQLQSGPSAVVGNTYFTYVSAPWSCALDFDTSYIAANDYNSTCFIGNSVYGGRHGIEDGNNPSQTFNTYNCSGNTFTLYPPFVAPYGPYGPDDVLSDVAEADAGCSPSLCGNTILTADCGLVCGGGNGSAVILNNNFGAVAYRAIGDSSYTGASLNTAEIYGNTFGQGVGFHVQVGITNGFGWFLGNNIYLNSNSNSVPPFFDPVSAPVHLSSD